MLRNLKAALFDLDGTVLDRRGSLEAFGRSQWERFDRLQGVERDVYVQTLLLLDRHGQTPGRKLFTGLVAHFDLLPDLGHALLADHRARFPGTCLLFPDAVHTLSELRASGLKLGLVTNGSVRMQSRKVECLGLSRLFDTIVISDAEGIAKPDRQIFHRTLNRLNVQPAQAVFVGDNPEIDLAGARAAGLLTIWRRTPSFTEAAEADAVVDELGELLALRGA